DTTVLRYFHVYGPKQDYSDAGWVVSIFTHRILKDLPITIYGDGTQQRSFTYVQDVVNANMMVSESRNAFGGVYNCASGINVTINELAENLFELLNKKVPVKYDDWMVGDIKKFNIDNSKLRSLGFEFETSFKSGLKKTIQWMKTAS
ncbi:MAG: NAD-dependent epimerase/dehydratase family protein, partial [Thermoplasmata archaeon]